MISNTLQLTESPNFSGTYSFELGGATVSDLLSSVRDAFSFMLQRIRWKNIFSNELNIKVKPLPKGVSVWKK
jgi:hypothetical protein